MRSPRYGQLVGILGASACAGLVACGALFDVSSLGPGDGAGPDGGDASSLGDGTTGADGTSDAPVTTDGPAPPGDAGSDARSNPDGAPARTDGGCPIGEGPPMVRANEVCVDATEVTEGHYDRFVRSDAGAAFAPSICGWNTTFVPSSEIGDSYAWPPPASDVDYPVQYVDWCDAATYCAWAGKRLCGAVKPGDTIDGGNYQDPSVSQWVQACSHNGERQYPYPGSYADVCALAVDGGGPHGVAHVKDFPGCEGGYDGIYDMVGNVQEWIDYCSGDGKSDGCTATGGAVWSGNNTDTDCYNHMLGYDRGQRVAALGFRCCAYPSN